MSKFLDNFMVFGCGLLLMMVVFGVGLYYVAYFKNCFEVSDD